jgi:DNA polymerase-3 subunit gamma/tau
VLDHVKKKKISTYALLLECQPVKVESQEITLSFNEGASFHCREIGKPQNLRLIRNAVKEILDSDLGISCILNGEIEEGKVETISDSEKRSKDEMEKIVPKPHIVKLVQDSFEAEVVDETEFE